MKKLLRTIFKALYAAYLAVLFAFTVLRPWNGAPHFLGGSVNARLMAAYAPILRYDPSLFIYLFFGNIVWFIPFGLRQGLRPGRTPGGAALRGFLLSLGIEAAQYLLGTGVSELDDLLLNTCGCLIGWCLARLLRRLRRPGSRRA